MNMAERARVTPRTNDRNGYTVPTAPFHPFQQNSDAALVLIGWTGFDEAHASRHSEADNVGLTGPMPRNARRPNRLPRRLQITAFQNVAHALRALETDADAVSAQAGAEEAAAQSLAASRRQFQLGAISYLSLLTAEQTYQQALLNLVEAQATRFTDTAALFAALGGGWWHRADVAQASRSLIPAIVDTPAR